MSRLVIKNGTVVLPDKTVKTNILCENGKIVQVGEVSPADCVVIDAENKIVTPGLIELHAHGGGGSDFCDLSKEAFENVVKTHFKHGVTLICPTLVSCSFENMKKVFGIMREAKAGEYGFLMDKLHLEGPYLSPAQSGAQRKDIIREPSKYETDALMDEAADIIGKISAAPEVEGVPYLAKKAVEKGIRMSIAHSSATAEETKKALDMGFNHITHLYSATTTVRKINDRVCAGILEAAYLYDEFFIELIGDGRHVAKETMQMALKIKSSHKINLTSDAMRAAGQDGVLESYLGDICPENRVIIDDGVAKLPDKSFYAGSIATGDRMLRNAVLNYDIPLEDAVRMLTLTPAKMIGADNKKGKIAEGMDSDIVIWNKDFTISDIITTKGLAK